MVAGACTGLYTNLHGSKIQTRILTELVCRASSPVNGSRGVSLEWQWGRCLHVALLWGKKMEIRLSRADLNNSKMVDTGGVAIDSMRKMCF